MSQGVPSLAFYPFINLPPFRRIPLIYLYYFPIPSGNWVVPYIVQVPFSGKLKIQVAVTEAGTFSFSGLNGLLMPIALNQGNALNANTLYEFEVYVSANTEINFQWTSSSSSVSSAYIYLYVYLELEGCEESGSE